MTADIVESSTSSAVIDRRYSDDVHFRWDSDESGLARRRAATGAAINAGIILEFRNVADSRPAYLEQFAPPKRWCQNLGRFFLGVGDFCPWMDAGGATSTANLPQIRSYNSFKARYRPFINGLRLAVFVQR